MAKHLKLSSFDPATDRVVIRKAGESVSRDDLDDAREFARTCLRVIRSGSISIGLYVYEPESKWHELEVVNG